MYSESDDDYSDDYSDSWTTGVSLKGRYYKYTVHELEGWLVPFKVANYIQKIHLRRL